MQANKLLKDLDDKLTSELASPINHLLNDKSFYDDPQASSPYNPNIYKIENNPNYQEPDPITNKSAILNQLKNSHNLSIALVGKGITTVKLKIEKLFTFPLNLKGEKKITQI
ncbi:hypothetical protein [Shewanella woodyi]|uniref:hypothetical protein n=1 Tax=Shewanella woodyi TaxID=60961 RepID=UPI00374A0668